MKKPTQCHLWQAENLKSDDLKNAFAVIERFVDESHFWRELRKCKTCGQLYFFEFYEEIDWEKGNDPQYCTYVPVETMKEIETVKNAIGYGLLDFSPRLQSDWPEDANQPLIRWVGR